MMIKQSSNQAIKQFLALILLVVFCNVSWAQARTYTYTAPNYSNFSNFTAPCAIPTCANFIVGTNVSGTFTTKTSPIAANLANADVSAQIASFSFSDGRTTYASGDPLTHVGNSGAFTVSTDATGAFTAFTVSLYRWQTPLVSPAIVHNVNDRIDDMLVNTTAVRSSAGHNDLCLTPGAGDVCGGFSNDQSSSSAIAGSALPVIVALPTFTIGGSVSGLATATSVVLQNNAGDDLALSANGAFTFGTRLISGAAYNATVLTQPAGQTCSVANGSSTVPVPGANVTNIAVSCVAASLPLSTIANVPTLGEWGLILLGGLLALVGVATVRRGRSSC